MRMPVCCTFYMFFQTTPLNNFFTISSQQVTENVELDASLGPKVDLWSLGVLAAG